MCEYCEGISCPISSPKRIRNMKKNLKDNIVYFGFKIDGKKIKFFLENDYNKQRELLLEREINYCPMCGRKLS